MREEERVMQIKKRKSRCHDDLRCARIGVRGELTKRNGNLIMWMRNSATEGESDSTS